jgi:hypothetical protein
MVMLRTYEHSDELAWMRTSAMMAMQANINRGKNSRPYDWNDFNPYASQRRRATPPPKITPKMADLFGRMGKTMKHGQEKRGT